MFIIEIWNVYLYEPVFNLLIWIYNNWTDQNMGWAVIYLTILLRVALLPLTFLSERDKIKNKDITEEISRLQEGYRYDPVLLKQEMRKMLRGRKMHPWSRALSLGIQLIVLLLLYQVFLQGVTGEQLAKTLYSFIQFPGNINTVFYGLDLALKYDIILPSIVTVWVFFDQYLALRRSEAKATFSDLLRLLLFPIGIFLLLYFIPSVKALFILTSMLFGVIIHRFIRLLIPKGVKKKSAKKSEEKKEGEDEKKG